MRNLPSLFLIAAMGIAAPAPAPATPQSDAIIRQLENLNPANAMDITADALNLFREGDVKSATDFLDGISAMAGTAKESQQRHIAMIAAQGLSATYAGNINEKSFMLLALIGHYGIDHADASMNPDARAAKEEKDAGLRRLAHQLMGQDFNAIPVLAVRRLDFLRDVIKNDPASDNRIAALTEFEQMVARQQDGSPLTPLFLERLVDIGRSNKADVNSNALDIISQIMFTDHISLRPRIINLFTDLVRTGDTGQKAGALRNLIYTGTADPTFYDTALYAVREIAAQPELIKSHLALRFFMRFSNTDAQTRKEAVDLLLPLLHTGDPDVSLSVSYNILDAIGEDRALDDVYMTVTDYLLGLEDKIIGGFHLAKLAGYHSRYEQEILKKIEDLCHNTDPAYRAAGVETLHILTRLRSDLFESFIMPTLLPAARDPSHLVRHQFAQLVYSLESMPPATVRPLLDALIPLARDESPLVRQKALPAFANLARQAETAAHDIIPILTDYAQEKEPEIIVVLGQAIHTGLEKWPRLHADGFALIDKLMAKTTDGDARNSLINASRVLAMDSRGAMRARLSWFIKLLDDPNPSTEIDALFSLKIIAQKYDEFIPELMPLVEPFTHATNEDIAATARDSFEFMKNQWQQKIDNEFMTIRSQLELALPAALQDEAAGRALLPQVIALTTTSDAPTRQSATDMIGKITIAHPALAAQGLPVLYALATDGADTVRLAVTRNLGMIAFRHTALAPQIAPPLQSLMTDKDPMIARLAQTALDRINAAPKPAAPRP